MRFTCLLAMISVGVFSSLHAQSLSPLPTKSDRGEIRQQRETQELNPMEVLSASNHAPTEEELQQLMERRRGDGSAGNIVGPTAFQWIYSDPTVGNAVRLLWVEETPNLTDVVIVVELDANEVGRLNVPGLDAANLPGTNFIDIGFLSAGPHTFVLSGLGDPFEGRVDIQLFDQQPMPPVSNVSCGEGPVEFGTLAGCAETVTSFGATTACQLYVHWDLPPAQPNYPEEYLLSVSTSDYGNPIGAAQITANGTVNEQLFNCAPPGGYDMLVAPWVTIPDQGWYRGAPVESGCTIRCEGVCFPPAHLQLAQTEYENQVQTGPTPPRNAVTAKWINTAEYESIELFVDDGSVGSTVTTNGQIISDLLPGDRKLGVAGACAVVTSRATSDTIPILSSTPHPSPISGNIISEFIPGSPNTTAVTWTNDVISERIDVYIVTEAGNSLLGALDGFAAGFNVSDTIESDRFALQFFTRVGRHLYGSELVVSIPPSNLFQRALCDGGGDFPTVGSAIFGLNFLFVEESLVPPCELACDADGDGRDINIGDMVYILNFLFSGGSPPAGWVDALTPQCELGEATLCATAHDVACN